MQKVARSLSTMLAMLALVCVSLLSFTACSDNDEPVAEMTYSLAFTDLSATTPDSKADKNTIESAFKTALGASGTATSVTRQGKPGTCDRDVFEACQRVFDSLKDEVWRGHYVFTVTNTTTGTTVCTFAFDADENGYTASRLKPGDYIYDDGTTSDGGLRGINDDATIEWANPKPQPKSGKTVVGVVFWTTSETATEGRNTPARLTDDKIMSAEHPDCTRGLAVAVKKVTYNGSEAMMWQQSYWYKFIKDWQAGDCFIHANKDKFVPIASGIKPSDNINRIYGYQNTVVLRAYNAYCNANDRSDYIVCPVAAIDEFAKNIPAPAGSTGWFLPSVKELHMLCYKDVDDVKNERGNFVTGDPSYTITRDIVNSSLATAGGDVLESKYNLCQSSTENEDYWNDVFSVHFNHAEVGRGTKFYPMKVRAVCAF